MIKSNILNKVPKFTKAIIKHYYLSLVVRPLPGGRFILKQPYKVCDITIPENFVTNGANIPYIFWFRYPPFDPKNLPFIVLHDYLCSQAKTKEDFKLADKYMKNFALALGRKEQARVFYLGVSFFTQLIRPIIRRLGLWHPMKLTAFIRETD